MEEHLQGFGEGSYSKKTEAWWEAENALADARFIGDLAVAAFFGADKDKARKELRNQYHSNVEAWRTNAVNRHVLEGTVEELRSCEKPVPPLHWRSSFRRCSSDRSRGSTPSSGNPPFAGHVSVVGANKEGYTDWLRLLHPESTGKCDLVAHFYRRAFGLLRKDGAFGLIATNTIAQGDTRASGLRWICSQGGEIFNTRKRVKWPGLAAVVVSVVHVTKGPFVGTRRLDGREVPRSPPSCSTAAVTTTRSGWRPTPARASRAASSSAWASPSMTPT